jgi:hypothetical protein
MAKKRQSRIQKKSTSRGRAVSFGVHLILLLVAFLPFLSFQKPQEASKEALVIQFDYPYNEYVKPEKFTEPEPIQEDTKEQEFVGEEGSKMSGSEAGGNETKAEPMQSRPQQAAPTQLSNPSRAAISTPTRTSTALSSKIGEINLPAPNIKQKQAWASVGDDAGYEEDGVEEMQFIQWSDGARGDNPGAGDGDGDDDSSVWSDGFGKTPGGQGGTGTGTGGTTGAGSGPGGGTGTGNAGDKTGVGQNGTGLEWGVGLDGALKRKVVQLADIKTIAVKAGKISISICIDRSGIVTMAKYDVANSTLKDPAYILKAEAMAKKYLFAQDSEAPDKECGKLTFIFKFK